ncbi:MAG TPA: hypothetical protein VGD81_09545 [Opitutaceae bacterium]
MTTFSRVFPRLLAPRWLAALGLLPGLFFGTVLRASVPDKKTRFDLAAASRPLLRAKWMHDRHHVPQSFAFDDVNGFIYTLQVEGTNAAGTHAEHSERGDLVLTKLSLAGNTIAGHMVLRGFGHGVAFGVEADGTDVYLWTEVDSEPVASGTGRGRRLGRFRFVDAVTVETDSPVLTKFALVPGARVCTPSLDPRHGRLAMRYISARGEWRAALYDLAAVKAGEGRPLRDIALPQPFGVVQGWCSYDDYLYVYSDENYSERNPRPGNARLWCIDWHTGAVVDTQPSRAFVELVYREPEGLAVQVADGLPRLCFGFGASVSANDPRRQISIAYKDALIITTQEAEQP